MSAMKQPRVAYEVEIMLSQYRITGKVHMHPGQRLSDFINGVKDFVPVTEAKIFDKDSGKEISAMSLLEINVHQIHLMYPVEGQPLPPDVQEPNEEIPAEGNDELKSMYVDPFKSK